MFLIVYFYLHCSDLKITDGDVRQRSAAAEIFKRYDDQRVGYITRHQFRPLYAELVAAGLTTLTLEKCMGDLDSNHDGIIQFNEFIVWLDTVMSILLCFLLLSMCSDI